MRKFLRFLLIAVSIVGLALIAFRCTRAIETRSETLATQPPTGFTLDALPRHHVGQ